MLVIPGSFSCHSREEYTAKRSEVIKGDLLKEWLAEEVAQCPLTEERKCKVFNRLSTIVENQGHLLVHIFFANLFWTYRYPEDLSSSKREVKCFSESAIDMRLMPHVDHLALRKTIHLSCIGTRAMFTDTRVKWIRDFHEKAKLGIGALVVMCLPDKWFNLQIDFIDLEYFDVDSGAHTDWITHKPRKIGTDVYAEYSSYLPTP